MSGEAWITEMRSALTEILENDDHYFTADWTPELSVDSAVDALQAYILESAAPRFRAEGWDAYESAPFEIQLTEDGKNWEAFMVNPFRAGQ